MDFSLSDDQRQMIASVRELAQGEFKSNAQRYMNGEFPWDNIKKLAKIGVLGMSVPEEYGGLGLPVFDTALILEEIAKTCYVTAMAVLGEAGVQTRVIAKYAPEAIKRRVLPKVVSGECILAICMTEPHAGTDVANYKTNAEIKGDRVIVNGTKTLISRASEAGMFVVFTRINRKPGREGIGCILLEPNTKGLEITGTFHTMGGENLHEVQFNNCEVPLENLVIREDGFRKLLTAFNTQRCLNPSISLGLAEGAFDEAVQYVKARNIFGRSLGDFQGIRWKLADMYRDIEAARGLLYRACATANPFPDPFMAAVAKTYCNEMSNRVTSEAIQVHGGYGFTDEYAVSRLYRGARYGTLGGGATETLKDLIGKKIVDGDTNMVNDLFLLDAFFPRSSGDLTVPTVAHVKALIGGARLSVDDHTFETVDPYRREVVARVDNATKEVVARAVATAAAAKPVIAATPAHERAALLKRIADEIRRRRDQLATAMAREVGKAIVDAYREVDRCPETIELSAEEAVRIEGAHIPMDATAISSGKLGITLRFPVGVVAAITPYNAPLNLACHKLGPALAAGNPVIIKPAPAASLTVDLLIEACIAAGTPHGWVNTIYGFEAGRYLVTDPAIDFISFTGSSAIGAEIRRQAPLKPATLELGGNGSTIVAADANLKTAAKVCATNAMRLAGQSCISVQNIFVHRNVVEKFQQLLLENVAALKVGDPLDSGIDLGPVIDVRSADRIVQTLKGATKTGNASILIGGSAHEALVDPTVVRLTKPEGALFSEEIFGPVANVVTFESLSEPVSYINAGRYGLQAGVFTRSIEPALQLAKSLRVGGVIINGSSTWRSDQAPYGGVKDSGAGREGPRFAIREMTEERLIVFNA